MLKEIDYKILRKMIRIHCSREKIVKFLNKNKFKSINIQ